MFAKKKDIKKAGPISALFRALQCMMDKPHCPGFLERLRVDLLFLTAESQGQLGLTLVNSLDHLETPTKAHRIIPQPPTHELHTY